MFKHSTAFVVFSILLLAGYIGVVSEAAPFRTITLEVTLLAFSPHPGYACGIEYVHQVAKYRVEKVLDGMYSDKEIVVDHPACDEDVFRGIPVGSRVKLTVRVLRKYGDFSRHPGIRKGKRPKIFYVATVPPKKI